MMASANIFYNGAGVATPDPSEAPPLAGFNMKSSVAYITPVMLFSPAVPWKNHGASPKVRGVSKEEVARGCVKTTSAD